MDNDTRPRTEVRGIYLTDTEAPGVNRRDSVARRLLSNRAALAGLIVIGAFGLMAVLAPWVDRYDPASPHYDRVLAGPSTRFWLGTDQLGRDQYSRLVHGARVSLAVGVFAQVVTVCVGLTVGMAAGLGGRRIDTVLMRLTDTAFAFPDLLMVILLVSVFGPSATMLILAIGLVNWPVIARLVRGQVLSLRQEEYVLAARALGASDWRIAWRHLLPNVLGPVIVTAAFGVPFAIFAEAALSFIGLGLPPPAPTWGILVTDSFHLLYVAPWLAISSCSAIALTMMGFTFIGDGLRDALDPRTASRRRTALPDDARATRGQPPTARELPRAA
jgi:ABC-type dipeptide/oligopeptide/nickel transport system permease subunit